MKLNSENHNRLIEFLKQTGILTLILLAISFGVWMVLNDHSVERLTSCLFWVGVVGVALGTIFGLNAHSSSEDAFYRHRIGATSMSIEKSRQQAWKDISRSYASAHLFLISGFAVVGLSLLIELFAGYVSPGGTG